MRTTTRLPRKPEARTEKVEDLVQSVLQGRVRVPRFQRGLKWQSDNVLELFDSIYRGYPIGSLLFFKRAAQADRLKVGPLTVDAPEISEAWWVVDGQQRITALTACLARPAPLPSKPSKEDPFVVFFDAVSQEFQPPPTRGNIPPEWVPLPYLLDASRLSEWIYGWEHGSDEQLRRVVFEAGARIREYPIPLYLIETKDIRVSRQIFYRTNKSGKPLQWEDVHKALWGGKETSPSTLGELSEELTEVGMGGLEESRLLTCLMALRGLDPTRTLADHIRSDPEILRNAVQESLPVLRRVLSFLRSDAAIPHLRLLPKSILLDVLVRFFRLHSDPRPRSRILLARWFWRSVLGAGAVDDRTLRRRGITAVEEDEEQSIQGLLALLHKERPRLLDLPASFDARADGSRIAMLALVQLGPRDLESGSRLDAATLLEEQDKDVFCKILKESSVERARSPANRIIQPKGVTVRKVLLERFSEGGPGDSILASHAIDAEAAERLRDGDLEGFLARRNETLTREVRRFAEGVAAWEHSDRPSVEYLLETAGAQL